jgi:DNA-binding NtrC family response regulator
MKESFDALIDHLIQGGFFLEQAVEILEKGMIERVLRRTEGNQLEASKILGIHRNTLKKKMDALGINGKHPHRRPMAKARGKALNRTRSAS